MPSSRDELKSAYRVAAKLHHPDAGGDEDSFVLLREAYDFLSTLIDGYAEKPTVDLVLLHEDALLATVRAVYQCPACEGKTTRRTCPECNGWGGLCKTCRGVKTVAVPCVACDGVKLISRETTVSIDELRSGSAMIDGKTRVIRSVQKAALDGQS
jgi:DnaJ-class molecular chaperone